MSSSNLKVFGGNKEDYHITLIQDKMRLMPCLHTGAMPRELRNGISPVEVVIVEPASGLCLGFECDDLGKASMVGISSAQRWESISLCDGQ